jgi:hypothetical protein
MSNIDQEQRNATRLAEELEDLATYLERAKVEVQRAAQRVRTAPDRAMPEYETYGMYAGHAWKELATLIFNVSLATIFERAAAADASRPLYKHGKVSDA